MLGAQCAGIIKKAGVEGIRIMPERMSRKLASQFETIGRDLALRGKPEDSLVTQLALPRKFSAFRLGLYRLLSLTGLTNLYWDQKLREHGAFGKRFARPYEPKKTAP